MSHAVAVAVVVMAVQYVVVLFGQEPGIGGPSREVAWLQRFQGAVRDLLHLLVCCKVKA